MSRGGRWIRRERRWRIYARDGYRCIWCHGEGPLTLDHLVPGADHRTRNLATACLPCNSGRQDRSVRAWLAILGARGHDVAHARACLRRVRR